MRALSAVRAAAGSGDAGSKVLLSGIKESKKYHISLSDTADVLHAIGDEWAGFPLNPPKDETIAIVCDDADYLFLAHHYPAGGSHVFNRTAEESFFFTTLVKRKKNARRGYVAGLAQIHPEAGAIVNAPGMERIHAELDRGEHNFRFYSTLLGAVVHLNGSGGAVAEARHEPTASRKPFGSEYSFFTLLPYGG